jgi:restriction endonuclease
MDWEDFEHDSENNNESGFEPLDVRPKSLQQTKLEEFTRNVQGTSLEAESLLKVLEAVDVTSLTLRSRAMNDYTERINRIRDKRAAHKSAHAALQDSEVSLDFQLRLSLAHSKGKAIEALESLDSKVQRMDETLSSWRLAARPPDPARGTATPSWYKKFRNDGRP